MRLIYLFAIQCYYLLVRAATLFNSKAREFIRGRERWFTDLESNTAGWGPTIWFHCASLGEFEQGRPLLEELRARDPEVKILLTFFSPSGYRVRKNYPQADYVSYLPLDTPRNARKFVDLVRPEKVFFIKYEYWYFMLRRLYRRNIPVYLVSAIFRKDQLFFRWYGGWFRHMLHFYSHLFVQDAWSRDLLKAHGIDPVTVSGDTRFDRVQKIAAGAPAFPFLERFMGDSMLVVGGSTWPPDEELLIRYYHETHESLKLVIAPHEVHKQNIRRLLTRFKQEEVLVWSENGEGDPGKARVLIIDTIGMLSSLYGYGTLAYVGGAFGKGLHNILEAATYGVPVIFGPRHQKFREANELVERGGAFAVSDYAAFKVLMDSFLAHPQQLEEAGAIAGSYVKTHAGATRLILSKISE
ncbi:MAG TPA: glycosyltransferase N-terminal domain-containing protein [Bacteroidales bacterium]|nr:glycosyltransferase N-terminal domain-containing protein [Bacteroidales bacterium]